MTGPWYESDNPDRIARNVGGRVILWSLAAIAFVVIVGGVLWTLKVATSDIKGQGDAVRTKNSAVNRIGAQERFEQRYQDILAADRGLDVLAAGVAANPASQVAAVNLAGATLRCQQIVADYNADARKYTAEAFRAEDLPASIDNLDAATDCAPTQPRSNP